MPATSQATSKHIFCEVKIQSKSLAIPLETSSESKKILRSSDSNYFITDIVCKWYVQRSKETVLCKVKVLWCSVEIQWNQYGWSDYRLEHHIHHKTQPRTGSKPFSDSTFQLILKKSTNLCNLWRQLRWVEGECVWPSLRVNVFDQTGQRSGQRSISRDSSCTFKTTSRHQFTDHIS